MDGVSGKSSRGIKIKIRIMIRKFFWLALISDLQFIPSPGLRPPSPICWARDKKEQKDGAPPAPEEMGEKGLDTFPCPALILLPTAFVTD